MVVDTKGFGDVVRWIKCLFKDCPTEDALRDHESAERERLQQQKERDSTPKPPPTQE